MNNDVILPTKEQVMLNHSTILASSLLGAVLYELQDNILKNRFSSKYSFTADDKKEILNKTLEAVKNAYNDPEHPLNLTL